MFKKADKISLVSTNLTLKNKLSNALECPICKNLANSVLLKTIKALVKDEFKDNIDNLEQFFFCKTPSCNVVYFSKDQIIYKDQLKIEVGLKEGSKKSTICYCFNWTKDMIINDFKKYGKCDVIDDIKNRIKEFGCFCEVKNPSGKCCLSDIKNFIDENLQNY